MNITQADHFLITAWPGEFYSSYTCHQVIIIIFIYELKNDFS